MGAKKRIPGARHVDNKQNDEDGINNNNKKRKTLGTKPFFKEKTFIPRESQLTKFMESQQATRVYYIVLVGFVSLLINAIINKYLRTNKLSFVSYILTNNFQHFPAALYAWMCMLSINLFVYPALHTWAYVYLEISHFSAIRKFWNTFGIVCIIFYYIKALMFAADFTVQHDLALVEGFVILTEQIRFIMKTHAFIRGNVPKVINAPDNLMKLQLPSLQHFFLFLFVPTVIYRDQYPRTNSIRWKKVFIYCAELLGTMMCMALIVEQSFVPICEQFSSSTYTVFDLAWVIFTKSLISLVLLMLTFYLVLHLWMNLFAELTMFADRQFYQDWWNSTTYEVFFRKWNIVVHEFLYVYIYKDVYEALPIGNKFLPKLAVFFVAAAAHEYIIIYGLRMFYPALFVLYFGLSFVLMYVRVSESPIFKILFLFGTSIGCSLVINAYVIEGCVRINSCATEENFKWYEPRTFSGSCLKL